MRWVKVVRALPLLPFAFFDEKKQGSKEENYALCRQWSKKIIKQMGYRLHIEGVDPKGYQGTFFVCNHQGTLDPALIISAIEQPVRFVSKKENESLPLLGGWAKKIDCIHFDRESREGNIYMLRETMRALKKKENVLIFPEGTRSKGDTMNPFLDKAFQPALMTKANIVPISISHSYVLDNANYRGKDLYITFGQAITPAQYKEKELSELTGEVHTWIQSHVVK